jgi:hypothetical protein
MEGRFADFFANVVNFAPISDSPRILNPAFPEIGKIPYEGPSSKNPLAFKHYDADGSSDISSPSCRSLHGPSATARRRNVA